MSILHLIHTYPYVSYLLIELIYQTQIVKKRYPQRLWLTHNPIFQNLVVTQPRTIPKPISITIYNQLIM
jgi:hypothetical protein